MENRVPSNLGLLWRHRPDINGVNAVWDVRFEVIQNYLLPLQWPHSSETGIDHSHVEMVAPPGKVGNLDHTVRQDYPDLGFNPLSARHALPQPV
jgi:hypothetical protein